MAKEKYVGTRQLIHHRDRFQVKTTNSCRRENLPQSLNHRRSDS